MPDIIDDAQSAEAFARLEALASVPVSDLGPGPHLIGGKACCIDCDAEIPPARLAARPRCSRCRECQEERDRLSGQFDQA